MIKIVKMKQVMKMVTMKVITDGHILSILTRNQLMENEQGRYLPMDVSSYDV